MINPIGQSISAAVDAAKARETGKGKAVAAPTATTVATSGSEVSASPASRMAAEGAPVDLDKVAQIKAAIASGNYPVDPDKIAERMMDLDLPYTGN